jgi:putative hydrolase of the HAD superfamily
MPAPRAILFNLDNTLTSRSLSLARFGARFAAHFAKRLGQMTPRGVVYGLVEVDGNGYRSHADLAAEVRDVFPWRERPSVAELAAFWDTVFPACVAPYPETLPTLRWLREHGLALGVVTNGGSLAQRAKIAALGLDADLGVILIAEEVGLRKPDPRSYLQALHELGIAPDAAWMVSVLPEDGLGARAAGLGAVFVRRIFYWPRDTERPVHEVTSLDELPPLVEAAEAQ